MRSRHEDERRARGYEREQPLQFELRPSSDAMNG
jgi:hypothetical protein